MSDNKKVLILGETPLAVKVIKALDELNLPIVSNCKHNVKNWDSERGTYLCSNCGKDFTNDL